MASMQEYLSMMSTAQLKSLLRDESAGLGSLPVDAIFAICDILSQRDPDMPTLKTVIRKICEVYLK